MKFDKGDWNGALADYNKHIELNPNNAIAYLARALVKKEVEDWSGAKADCDKHIELNPRNAVAYTVRALVLRAMGENSEADWNKAVELEQGQKVSKTLTDYFRSLSITSIKSQIVAALSSSRGKDALGKSLEEILSPECVNVIAEKAVSDSIENFVDFYHGDYDSPPNLKKSVAAVIAGNHVLRSELATKVARSGYRDMVGWFQQFSFYCPREIVVDVENAFTKVAGDPDFQERFGLCSSDHLRTLIDHFTKFGCVGAAHILKKLCVQDDGKQIKPTPRKR